MDKLKPLTVSYAARDQVVVRIPGGALVPGLMTPQKVVIDGQAVRFLPDAGHVYDDDVFLFGPELMDLDALVARFRSDLGEIRGRMERDHVRAHAQGKLLDALDAGATSTAHDPAAEVPRG